MILPVLIQRPLEIRRACLFALAAVASFHLAYGVPACQWLMVGPFRNARPLSDGGCLVDATPP